MVFQSWVHFTGWGPGNRPVPSTVPLCERWRRTVSFQPMMRGMQIDLLPSQPPIWTAKEPSASSLPVLLMDAGEPERPTGGSAEFVRMASARLTSSVFVRGNRSHRA